MTAPEDAGELRRGWKVGMTIGQKYALVSQVGEGGMGTVFEAKNTWTGRRVALKVLRPEFSTDAQLAQRFIQEAHTASAIRHPNIVDVLDLGVELSDGSLFLVLEFLEGQSLRRHLERGRRFSVVETIDLLVPVMGALRAAHAMGIVHRDLKPENIMVSVDAAGERVPKLIDFGISRMRAGTQQRVHTITGAVLGTPAYMAPEQARGYVDVDHRADLWALGVLWYECLTGRGPFTHKHPGQTLHLVLEGKYEPLQQVVPGLPPGVADFVHRALSYAREDRYQDLDAMLQALVTLVAPLKETGGSLRKHTAALEHQTNPVLAPSALSGPGAPPAPEHASEDGRRAKHRAAHAVTELELAQPEAPIELQRPTALLERELAKGNFEYVAAQSEHVLRRLRNGSPEHARALFLRGSALRWLGKLREAEPALRAAEGLQRAELVRWCDTAEELAWVSSERGERRFLLELQGRHGQRVPNSSQEAAALLRAGSSLGLALLRAGFPQEARSTLQGLEPLLHDELLAEPRLHGYVLSVRAGLALQHGDLGAFLKLMSAAAESHEDAGNAREGALAGFLVADAYRAVGAYDQAMLELEKLHVKARGLGLAFVSLWLRCLAASCDARRGGAGLEEAEVTLQAVASEARGNGHRRAEVVARVNLATLRSSPQHRPEEALAALAGWPPGEDSPEEQGFLLALSAQLAHRSKDLTGALEGSSQAFRALTEQSFGEAEALVRLVHAELLLAVGEHHRGWGVLAEARRRLGTRARKISNKALRHSFLADVAEHAQTMRLASRWLDLHEE